MCSPSEVDADFTKSLPKAELHAHLSGSISKETLHDIWLKKQDEGHCVGLEDPLTAIRSGSDGFVDVASFFPLFDKYIYNLCNDLPSVEYALEKVVDDFEADGVQYLELRTTPRECVETGMSAEAYIGLVNDVIGKRNRKEQSNIEARLILSIDRRMSAQQAMQVLNLAIKFQQRHDNANGQVVGLDLCGNPRTGNLDLFTPTFEQARKNQLGITVHFAEVPESSTDHELQTILSWEPNRLGHCIHLSSRFRDTVYSRFLGLEICVSCNVLAGLTSGGFANHHLGELLQGDCPIALSTDDVGIFGSKLSNEYLISAQTFALSKQDLLEMSRDAVTVAFAGKQRMTAILDAFEKSTLMDWTEGF